MEKKKIGYIFLLLILIIGTNAYHFSYDDKIKISFFIVISIVSLLIYLRYFLSTSKIVSWLDFRILFLVGYYIVFYQYAFLDVLGFVIPTNTFLRFWISELNKYNTIYLVTNSILVYYLFSIISSENFSDYRTNSELNFANKHYILLCVSFLLYFSFLSVSGGYALGQYSSSGGASSLSTYIYKLFKIFFTATLIIRLCFVSSFQNLTFLSYIKKVGIGTLSLYFIVSLISFISGDRGAFIYFSGILFSLFVLKYYNVKFKQLLILILVLSTFMSLIGEVRQARFEGGGFIDRVSSSSMFTPDSNNQNSRMFDSKVPLDSTLELATSIRSLTHPIYYVPSTYPYFYGTMQFRYIVSIIPGLSSTYDSIVFDGSNIYNGSSSFITYLVQGDERKYGNGTTIISDVYLDFGMFGVLISMVIFSVFIEKNIFKLKANNQIPTFGYCSFVVFYGNSIYLSRSAFFIELSNIILIYVIIHTYLFMHKRLDL